MPTSPRKSSPFLSSATTTGNTDATIRRAKKKATDAGAKITQEYSLIKGFAVEYPEGTVVALDQDPNVQSVEKDHVVTTQ
ncbi:hypothetical protein M419DRAFT_79498 [Trichoderma reesei RUT C-30]|uniref:Inhibitor I9 domain-containing protein n=1 Tax=Hypocrea jecorina (strain ATCC 56765 / BCRC 32924 / NRRL 11460 / Rut C-30) TaxID=1344414 RepID=A0A024S9H0_HYPJR|nr:hypothetical protein M419DRAFT_79498 [Trichoderma reesei RUT C-30]